MTQPSTPSKLDALLKNLGFIGNPFASLEAGKEEGQDWFYESFVEPPHFDEIVGDARSPQPMLVFAPRGSGKTALRVMVHYYCQRGYVPGGPVLSILHTDLSLIQEVSQQDPKADLARYHVRAILRAGVAALARQVETDSALRERLDSQQPEEHTYLRWFVSHFGEDLSPAQWRHLRDATLVEREGMEFQSSRSSVEVSALRSLLERDSVYSYVSLLRNFVHLVRGLGFQAVYVLVDGADELASTAAEFGHAARLVEPLAANLQVLDMPGVAFRLFLPAETRPYLEMSENVRPDRVEWYSLEWSQDRLLGLLRRRLEVFSKGRLKGLDLICSAALTHGRLEQEMVKACNGSPRTLLLLGREVLTQQALLASEEENLLISEVAWQQARQIVNRRSA